MPGPIRPTNRAQYGLTALLVSVIVASVGTGGCGLGANRQAPPSSVNAVRARPARSSPLARPSCPSTMALLPGGAFTMRRRYDAVTVQPFCMDITEVTAFAYAACVSEKACAEPIAAGTDEATKMNRACNWKRTGAGLHPMNCVDWEEATSFCAWAGKRLPSEEEWEWAARGASQGSMFPWGEDFPSADRMNGCGTECAIWVKTNLGNDSKTLYAADDGWPNTAPVGSFPRGATPQGIQDMAGNVWEWTSSDYGLEDHEGRVVRGGSWGNTDAYLFNSSDRTRIVPSARDSTLGFRCASGS